MATYLNPDISRQGILNVGDTTLYACPRNYLANIASIKVNCPSAFDISVRIEKSSPVSILTLYSFNLDAGDYMIDANSYPLRQGDSVVITTSASNVTYFTTGTVYPKQP
jgi:hypothetical protein